MNASFKIPVHKLSTAFIKEMQEKYGDAELEITVNPKPNFQVLKEADFWRLIGLLDWKKSTDEAILEPLIQELSKLAVGHIYNFQETLSQKLYALDQQIIAENIGKYAYQSDHYFSVDHFLYARAGVVANGEEAFNDILSTPSKMFQDITFEPLLTVASTAYTRKTGDPFIYIPSYNLETYSNKEGWQETQRK